MNKVVIFVEVGVVQDVYVPVKSGINVELIDFDNLEADGYSRKDRDTLLEHSTQGLKSAFFEVAQ